MSVDFDVAIIGGGPAGSGLASYLAQAGVQCLVLERELFPRPHVGESLVPGANRVLGEIGFIDQMDANRFPKKYGAVWTSSFDDTVLQHDWLRDIQGAQQADIRFGERSQEGVTQDYTWHVDRSKFDSLLLQHAQSQGAAVLEGVQVRHVEFPDGEAHAVIHASIQKQKELQFKVRLVIDASGRKTLLGNQLKLKVRDPVFDQYAVHTWFEGFDRKAIVDADHLQDYIHVHFLPVSNSWVWQIPITDSITSVGVVTQKKHFARSKASREAFFWDCIKSRSKLYEGLQSAEQVRPLTEEGDYSYAMKEVCGDRYVLIGDAARFVDPIFSSGVSIALNAARFVKTDIIEALKCDPAKPIGASHLANYETTIRRGMKNWHKFISLYYRLNVLFSLYIQDHRYRLDVLKLLQGEVYDEEEPEVLAEMERAVREVEENEDHVLHKLLGDLTAQAFRPTV